MIGALDVTGVLDLVGLAGIITAMAAFQLKNSSSERSERESMREEYAAERKERDEAFTKALSDERRQAELVWGNHLSRITKAMNDAADRLSGVEREMRALREGERRGT